VRSVSTRLTFLFLAATGLLLGLFAASLWVWVRANAERDLERELEMQSRAFGRFFAEEYAELLRGDPVDLAREMQAYLDVGGTVAEVRSADGRVLFSSSGFSPARPGFRFAVEPIPIPPAGTGTLRYGITEEPLRNLMGQLRLFFALFLPLSLLLSWIAGLLFVRRALAPVEEIRRRAERISRVNIAERVPVPPPRGEFHNLARTFNEMLDRLQGAIEDLQNFASDAAHELRTPLANLRTEIETALQHPRPPSEHAQTLASLLEEVVRMNRIVTDLFTLARLDLRQYALSRERVPLLPLLREARETWSAVAAERGISIRVEGEEAAIEGDPQALRRVLMNLTENAVKYNRPGGSVTLSLQRAGDKVLLKVADTGIGIPAESLPRLFRRFYRVDKARSRQSGGTGLGLAICKSFVEAHGGRIDVSSTEGRGTVFTVELPTPPQGSVQDVNHQAPARK